MKRILLMALTGAFISGTALAQSPKFVLSGDVSKLKEPIDWVYLIYNAGTQRISDSVQVVGGKYSFSGNVPEPTQAALRARYKQVPGSTSPGVFNRKRDYAMLFIQPGTIGVASAD